MGRLNQLLLQLIYLPVTILMVTVEEVGKFVIASDPVPGTPAKPLGVNRCTQTGNGEVGDHTTT